MSIRTRSRSFSHSLTCFFSLFLICLPAAALAQDSARLAGTVTSAETGTSLPGASVQIPALERGTSTGADGTYRLTGLAPGAVRVRVSYVGYEPIVREVRLERGTTTTLDAALSPQRLQGEEVVVTGTPVAQSTLRSTQDVRVAGPEDLETERTAALGDLLEETVPGAASVKTGPQAGKPVLRGLTGNRVKLLKNGVGQEYYQFGVRHFPNTSLLEAERIEVVRGPASLLYGSDALGGAVNVLTKEVPDAGLGGRFGGQYFTGNSERVGFGQLQGGTALGANATLGARAGLERRVAGNFTTPDAATFFETGNGGTFGDPKYTGEIPFTNFDQWSGYGQIGVSGDFGSASFYGEGWQNEQNFILPPGGPDDDNPDTPPVLGLGQNLEQYSAQFRASLPAGDFVFKPRLSYQRAVRQSAGAGNTLEVIEEAEENGGFDYPIDLEKEVYTGRLEVLHPTVGGFSGTLGAEAIFQDGQSLGPVPLEPTAEVLSVGAFVFEEFDLDPVTLSGGLRVDYRQQDADPPEETLDALDITDGEELEKSYTTLSGSVGASYVFVDGFSVFSNLGTGFRAPSIFELYANGQHGGVAAQQQGNPALAPERTYSADLGLRARSGSLTGAVVGYYTHFTNYLFLRNTGEKAGPDSSGPPIYTSGQTEAGLGGVEANARVAVLPWLTVGGEAAFLTSRGEDLEANAGGDRLLPLIPADRLGAHVRFELEDAGSLKAPFAQVKVHHAFSKDAAGRYEPFAQFDAGFGPPFGTASTKGYTLVDVSAGATLDLGLAQPRLSAGVKNLLDKAYRNFLDTYKGYALSPGRNVFVKLSVPFSASD